MLVLVSTLRTMVFGGIQLVAYRFISLTPLNGDIGDVAMFCGE